MPLSSRLYNESEHRDILEGWAAEFDQKWSLDKVPALGWVASDGFGPVAAGFLVQTDAKFGILECFVSNKSAPAALRHKALDIVRLEAEEAAKELGYTRILAYLQHDGLLRRAIDSGYTAKGHSVLITKDI